MYLPVDNELYADKSPWVIPENRSLVTSDKYIGARW